MLTYEQPDLPQPIPAACAWLREHRPEYALPETMVRRIATTPGSGLPCICIPSGLRRRVRLLVRPADIVTYITKKTI